MVARVEPTELNHSSARGAADRWGVEGGYEIRDNWILGSFENARIYAPLEHAEIPHHLSKVTCAEDIPAFLTVYGRLGWKELHYASLTQPGQSKWQEERNAELARLDRLKDQDLQTYKAEPIDWFLGQAATVRWCLEAGDALKQSPRRHRDARCRTLGEHLPQPAANRERLGIRMYREKSRDRVSPVDFVGKMLEDYLVVNLRGVHRQVEYAHGQLRSLWGGWSLIESIYTLIADAVTGGTLAQCRAKDCGAVFIQTDLRQQFCPPTQGQEKSACMNRERVRRQRRGAKHGKSSRQR